MQWPLIRDTLKSTISSLSGVPPSSVVWKGDLEEGSVVMDTRIVLAVNSVKYVSFEEHRRTDSLVPGLNSTVTIVWQRTFMLSINVYDQTQLPGSTAREIIDKISIRLMRDAVITQLQTVGLAVLNVMNITHLDYVAQGRPISRVAMDIQIGAVETEDDTEIAGGFINEVTGSGTVGGPQGNTNLDFDVKGP